MNRMVMVLAVGIILALPLFGGVEGSWSGTLDAMGQKGLREYADLKDWEGPLGMEAFRAALRDVVKPKAPHEEKPDIAEMPDTTGDEIPAEALRFATFLKLDPPKKKSHPSRGNIHS